MTNHTPKFGRRERTFPLFGQKGEWQDATTSGGSHDFRVMPECQPLNVGLLLNDVSALVTDMFPKSIRVKTAIPQDLWLIEGDRKQMQQVLFTFCINARDAMPSGGTLTVRASNIDPRSYNGRGVAASIRRPHVLMEISDTGGGLGPEALERIVLRRITTTTVEKQSEGGIPTVLGVVQEHGGVIDIQAAPVRGTTFQVYIPALLDTESWDPGL